jgi:hypothetical protein
MRLQWPEHRVSVQLDGVGLSPDAMLVTDTGHEVRPDRLAVTIWSIELERCDAKPPGMRASDLLDVMGDAVSMSRAYAHAERAPNRIWRSRVVTLDHQASKTIDMGEMTPSPGEYCRIRVLLQAADEDSLQLDEAPDMQGVAACAAGRWRSPGDESWQAFDWTSSRTVERVFELEEPLVLGEDAAFEGQITLAVDAVDWFSGATVAEGQEAVMSTFLGNVRQSITLEEAP